MPKTEPAHLAAVTSSPAAPSAGDRVSSIPADVSLMTLDAGLYCILVAPSNAADGATGLPGVRITAAPGQAGRADSVQVRTVSPDGWLSGFGDAALVSIVGAPAPVMVTIYHRPGAGPEGAPQLQVLTLFNESQAPVTALLPAPSIAPTPEASAAPKPVTLIAHIQTRGDVGANFGEWLGIPGSGHWIEGFGIAPSEGVALADIEYQAVLGRGWVSPWVEGGQFCGSRGMALPVLGLRVRLRGDAAKTHALSVQAAFVDGSTVGPVNGGEPCETEGLVALEALRIELKPINETVAAPQPSAKPAKPAKPAPASVKAAKPAAKPATKATVKPLPKRR